MGLFGRCAASDVCTWRTESSVGNVKCGGPRQYGSQARSHCLRSHWRFLNSQVQQVRPWLSSAAGWSSCRSGSTERRDFKALRPHLPAPWIAIPIGLSVSTLWPEWPKWAGGRTAFGMATQRQTQPATSQHSSPHPMGHDSKPHRIALRPMDLQNAWPVSGWNRLKVQQGQPLLR